MESQRKLMIYKDKNKTNTLLLILLLATLYYLFGLYSLTNTVKNSIVTISPFFSEGFALAFVLIYGTRVIPGIFLGQFLLAYSSNYYFFPSLFISAINSLEAFLGYYILIKIFKFDTYLTKLKDIYLLIMTIFFILQPFSAISSVTALSYFSVISKDNFLGTSISWYFGNIIGQLLVTPTLLYIYTHYKKINYSKLLFVSFVFGMLCYISIITVSIQSISVLFSITIIPLVLMLSYKNGLGYALLSVFIITQVAIYTFQQKTGLFSIYSDLNNIININLYRLSHILIVLVIGTLIIEKNQAVYKYKRLNTILQEKVQTEVAKNREKDKIMLFQSKMAQTGETIAMIAHQWRQPLNNLAIINQSLYIKYKKDRLNEKIFQDFFNNSKEQIELMSHTIDDFREFFKPDKEKSVFCINDTIIHLLNLTKFDFDMANIFIQKDCDLEVFINGYKNEFAQAVLNILNNAKDTLLQRQILNKKITISLTQKSNIITLQIKDNAKGIDENILEKIFEPYFSTKKNKNGTGLGLYMTKIIIEEHLGGNIKAYNNSEGAVFEIKLKHDC